MYRNKWLGWQKRMLWVVISFMITCFNDIGNYIIDKNYKQNSVTVWLYLAFITIPLFFLGDDKDG